MLANNTLQYDIVYAIHDFNAEDEDEVSFKAGQEIVVLERDAEFGDGWWMGRTQDGQIGLFPANFTSPTPVSPTGTETSGTTLSTGGNTPETKAKHPKHRESVQSFDALDQCETFISELRKSIHSSSVKLQDIKAPSSSSGNGRRTSYSPPPPPVQPPALPTSSSSPLHSQPHSRAISPTPTAYSHSLHSSAHHSPMPASGRLSPNPAVADWLSSVGFANCVDNFIRNEITGDAMLSLSLPTLKELDIPALGKRIQIMNSIISLKEEFGLQGDDNSSRGRGGAARSIASAGSGSGRGRSAHPTSVSPVGRRLSPQRSPNMAGSSASTGEPLARMASPALGAAYLTSPIASNSMPLRSLTPTPRDALDINPGDLAPVDCDGLLKTLENMSGYGQLAGKDTEWKRRWMALKGNALYWFKCDSKDKDAIKSVTGPALQCIYLHSGFRVGMDESIRSGKHAFRVTELNPDAGPPKHWVFYTDDHKECRKWMRALTKATIFHSQHEESKRGTQGVEVIGNPRDLIRQIRMPDDHQLVSSELGQISREWIDEDPGAKGAAGRPPTGSGSGRRPSLPGSQLAPGGPELLSVADPIGNLRSKSTEPYDRHAGATSPAPSASQPAWDDGREREIERLRNQGQYVHYINSALPKHEHISGLRDLMSGITFIHFLANVTQNMLPPHFVRAVRDPAKIRIDFLDNWDVVLSWMPELGIDVPMGVTVEKLASGQEVVIMDVVEAVQGKYAPLPPVY
ncbi:hypothetical protein BCR44DRAFT_118310 [Catenaria anguillulae PL171]|uniref:Uncharacterized protein n=1 Tax=Catenaria anguillulae PL171 TaxID=765915 RepID=A0A1Y2HH35_9FUNG|nr:hypothetical protein BCR44DRAFT_118310 [Catenaria anguillulae PL171]